MILEHVVLENVRSHKRTEIIFKRGTTLLSGDVGAGKSSILMAIEFALFGLGSRKADALLSKRANSATVELSFSVDGATYEIKRVLKKTENRVLQDSKGSYLSINGEKQVLSTAEMKQRVMKILRFNEPYKGNSFSRIFRYAVFTPQEEMRAVLSEPGDRLATVRRAFGIEDYKTAADNAKMIAAEITRRASEFEGRAAGAKDIKERIESCKKQLRDSEGRLAEAREGARKSGQELEALRSERGTLSGQEAEKAELDKKMAGAEAAVAEKSQRRESLKAEISKDEAEAGAAAEQIRAHVVPEKPTEMSIGQIDAKIQESAEAEKELAGIQARSKAASDEIAGIEAEMGGRAGADAAVLQSEAESSKSSGESALKMQKDAEQRAREAEYTSRQCAEDVSRIEKASAEALQEGAKCPVCENVITGDHLRRVEKERGEKRARLESDAAAAEQERSRASAEAEKMRAEAEAHGKRSAAAEKIAELAARRAAKLAEIRETAGRVAELEKVEPADRMRETRSKLAGHQEALAKKEVLVQRLRSAEENARRRRSELSSVEDGLAGAEAQMAEAAAGLEKFAGLDEKIAGLDSKIAERYEEAAQARAALSSRERDVANYKTSLKDDESRLAESEKWAKERDRHRDYARWLTEFFAAAMPAIERRVMRETRADFDKAYRGWYARLVDDYTKESTVDEEFAPRVRQDGFDQDVAYMSGGERTGVALAYRLALNSVLRTKAGVLKSSLLILDEPTDGFSSDQMAKIKEILDELDSEQIILVSHDPNLVGFAQHVVRVYNDGESSRVEA